MVYILVPVDQTSIKTLYVFVEIGIDRSHLLDTVRANFPIHLPSTSSLDAECSTLTRQGPTQIEIALEEDSDEKPTTLTKVVHLAVVGTVQFVAAVQGLKTDLEQQSPLPEFSERLKITEGPDSDDIHPEKSSSTQISIEFRVTVPQVKPLSPGEILGCTAPKLNSDVDAILCGYHVLVFSKNSPLLSLPN